MQANRPGFDEQTYFFGDLQAKWKDPDTAGSLRGVNVVRKWPPAGN